ncbi:MULTISPECIES: hypothetical protein [Pseudomonas]|uniref:hypothetical protein n=1 Tax=Pseudomonas TaxID=286 RepID=UPI0014753604|nr:MULTISPECIES: hypothetical protein [Pseudomonas]MEC4242114.1 hypothetical protein [Pseudomonas sp. DSV-1]NNB34034.1 hypothetical protein [Pseudomonas fragi]
MSNDQKSNDTEYGFTEKDLQTDGLTESLEIRDDSVLRAEPDDVIRRDIRGPREPEAGESHGHESEDEFEEIQPEGALAKPSFFSKYRLHILGGGAVLIMLCGLGWVASQVLKPTHTPIERVSSIETFGASKHIDQPHANTMATEPLQFGDDSSSNVETRESNSNEHLIESGGVPVQPIIPRNELEPDEKFYDTLVEASERNSLNDKAGSKAAPAEVSAGTDEKFAAISVAIANSGKEMTTVLETLRNISGEITALKTQIAASSTKTDLVEGKLNQLTLSMNELSKSTEARFNDISKTAVAAAMKAMKLETAKNPPSSGKLVLVGGAIKSDYPKVQTPAKRVEVKSPQKNDLVATQTKVQAQAKPQVKVNEGNQAVQCGARTVSQIWKVKGVTATGAYVRRDDGKALMLREDAEVPGFGRVKSFDPNSRTVCTTSGLIAR